MLLGISEAGDVAMGFNLVSVLFAFLVWENFFFFFFWERITEVCYGVLAWPTTALGLVWFGRSLQMVDLLPKSLGHRPRAVPITRFSGSIIYDTYW